MWTLTNKLVPNSSVFPRSPLRGSLSSPLRGSLNNIFLERDFLCLASPNYNSNTKLQRTNIIIAQDNGSLTGYRKHQNKHRQLAEISAI